MLSYSFKAMWHIKKGHILSQSQLNISTLYKDTKTVYLPEHYLYISLIVNKSHEWLKHNLC